MDKSATLEDKMDYIIQLLEEQRPISVRLDQHISFVEAIYCQLRSTIRYVTSFFGAYELTDTGVASLAEPVSAVSTPIDV